MMMRLEGSDDLGPFCDGVSRRSFLRIGGLGLGGLALPQLLRAQQASPRPARGGGLGHKAVIMVYMPGGPPHQDMYDLKTDAPSEVRGIFRPIRTNVAGIQICELLPRLAGMMDKLVPIRTIVGAKDRHESFQCLTGRLNENLPRGGWPELGAVVSKLQGGTELTIPPFMALSPRMQHRPYNNGTPGFLGPAFAPFKPEDEGKADLTLNGISLERLEDRKALLAALDRFRRDADAARMMDGQDAFTQQAFGMLTSSRLAEALDLSKEDPKVRERYGTGTAQHQGDGAPRLNQQFLMARRLVEAGVRCVTFSYSFWDWHGGNFENAKRNLPDFDQAMSALVGDLHERGLDRDVTVIAWGEFGRTPMINKDAGRDHWPRVSCALLAGGGMKTGQVIGSTVRDGGEPADRPVHFQEVFATLYHNLGIDVEAAQVTDL
ncbi:MAG TPA: DUF1501 domain-containing protein, partial [Planctomycetota bacterium]|nr:DUF1501 domain-containing protein [Planctomycetota bacterium]